MRRADRAAPLLVAVVVAALTWPDEPRVAVPYFDTFWQVALHVAANEGRDFGPGFTFTWGPLGFLSWPQGYYEGTAVAATLVLGGAYVAALTLVARRLCRALGLIAGALATFAVAQLAYPTVGLPELLEGIFMILCVSLVLDRERKIGAPVAAGLATLAAFTLLVKISAGTVTVALLLVTLALPALGRGAEGHRDPWPLVVGLLTYPVALMLLWVVARQSLPDLPTYFSDGFELTLGYPSAVALEAPGRGAEYAFAGGAALAIAVLVHATARPLPRPRAWVLAALFAVYLVLLFRHGFTRHDEHSLFAFFAPVLLATTALVSRERLPLAAVAAVPLVLGCLSQRDLAELIRVDPGRAADSLAFVISGDERSDVIVANREAFRLRHDVPPEALERIGRRPVHIDLSESSVAWAYPQLNWRPLPVLQSWNAYTRRLDDKNADFLASAAGPRFVLRRPQTGAPDRNPRFESPRATVELICRFREVGVHGTWQLLERGPDRCGAAEPIASRRAVFGTSVPVPPGGPSDVVAARFTEFENPVGEAVRALLLKPRVVRIEVGDGLVSRLPMGSAGNLHVMRLPGCLGYDPGLFPAQPYRRVALSRGSGGDGSFRVAFYRLSFRCEARTGD